MSRSWSRALVSVALLLVAAPSRAETIKVPSQFETIAGALVDAADGDTISVAKGVYRENVTVSKAVTLKGSSGAVIDGDYLDNCITVTVPGVTLSGFTLVNGGAPPILDGPLPTGGLLITADGVSVSKLTIVGCQAFGIRLVGTGTIENCKVSSCAGAGIEVDTVDSSGQTVTVIRKNSVSRCSSGFSLQAGPFLVESNTAELNAFRGLEVQMAGIVDGAGATLPSEISKNKCTDNAEGGLHVAANLPGVTTLVEKNTCSGNGIGITLLGALIDAQANTASGSRNMGIFLITTDSTLNKSKVQHNGGGGVWVGDEGPLVTADGASLGGNVVSSNTIQDNGGDGLRLASSSNSCLGNTIKDNDGDGIDIDAGVLGSILEENKLQDNAHEGIDNTGTDTTIFKNKVKGSGGPDIAGQGDGAGTVLAGQSDENVVDDESDLTDFATPGELELQTVFVLPG